jgi:predicted nuclease of predicted toxin-antitoxin system
MNVKLDENLPESLSGLLGGLGHKVHTVRQEALAGYPDSEIWRVVQREERFLVTQDLGFSDVRKFPPGTHHGILLLRLRSPSRGNLIQRVVELFQDENVELWRACLVVATENKVRITHS